MQMEVDSYLETLTRELKSSNQKKMQKYWFLDDDCGEKCSDSDSPMSSDTMSDSSEKPVVVTVNTSEVKEARRKLDFSSFNCSSLSFDSDEDESPKAKLINEFLRA